MAVMSLVAGEVWGLSGWALRQIVEPILEALDQDDPDHNVFFQASLVNSLAVNRCPVEQGRRVARRVADRASAFRMEVLTTRDATPERQRLNASFAHKLADIAARMDRFATTGIAE